MSELETDVYYRFIDELNSNFSFGPLHPQHLDFLKLLKQQALQKGHVVKNLGDLISIREEKINPSRHPEKPFKYVGLASIESGTGRMIRSENCLGKNILSRSSCLLKGDIVFGRLRSYLNKAHLMEKDAIGSTEFYVCIPNKDLILPDFLLRYMLSDLTLEQTKWLLTGNSFPRLGEREFLNLQVVVPQSKTKIQNQIIKQVTNLEQMALKNKKKAQQSLEDAYGIIPKLLSIKIPEVDNCDYYVLTSEKFEDRLDFQYNQKHFRDLNEEITSSDSCMLGDLVDDGKGITNGIEIRDYVDSGTPYIRIKDVTNHRLNMNKVARVQPALDEITKDIRLEPGNIVVSRSGTLGIVLLIDENLFKNAIISSHLIRIVLKKKINDKEIIPEYIAYFLRSKIGQLQFEHISYGTGTPEINQDSLSKLRIILPIKEIQKSIVDKVTRHLNKHYEYEEKFFAKWKESRDMFIKLLNSPRSGPP